MPVSDIETQEARGLSAGQLVLIFLAGVAVCALFFSAGFLVGYNERLSKAPTMMEQVTAPSEIPPLVTQPAAGSSSHAETQQASTAPEQTASQGATEVTHPEPLRPQPLSSPQPAKPAPSPGSEAVARRAEESPAPASASATPPAQAPPAAAPKPSAPVSAEPSTPQPPSREAGTTAGGTFVIQVAATGNEQDANKIVAALKALAYSVILVTPEDTNAGDNLYRVQVGPFTTRDSADRIREKLIQDGFKSPFIKSSGK